MQEEDRFEQTSNENWYNSYDMFYLSLSLLDIKW